MLVSNSKKIMTNEELMKISPEDYIPGILKKYIKEGKYNDGEDLLFKELEKGSSEGMMEIAVEFYNSLLAKSDEELESNDFSREEVYQGLEDIKKFVL